LKERKEQSKNVLQSASKQQTSSIKKISSHKDFKVNNKMFKENNFAARYKSPSPAIKKTKMGQVASMNLKKFPTYKTPIKDDKKLWH
jgi:hypothetical protein